NISQNTFQFNLVNPSSIGAYEWDFGDGSPVSYAANPTHYYLQPGNYIVRLKLANSCGNGTDTTTVHILSGTGIDEMDASWTIGLYPNPAKDRVEFKVDEGVIVEQVFVYNMLGQLVHRE